MHAALIFALFFFLAASFARAQAIEEPRLDVSAFEIEGDLPIPQATAQAILAPYARSGVTLTDLRGAAKALETELSARGFPFYRVVLPAQAIENVVKLRVLAFRLANIVVSKNEHFSRENVLASLPALKLGESPNVAAVARNRAAVNEHPSKQVEVNFTQGDQPDTVNAEVTVQDEKPQRFFIGLNNTGERRTGHYRASLGYQHSNLFGRDHSVTASYTTSPEKTSDVKQYGLYYRVPFYAVSGALTVFYAFSDVNSGTIANAFEVSGRGRFSGLHYRQHLTPIEAYAHALEIGLDDRFFDNDVVFGTTQLGVDVRTRPVSLTYQGRLERASSSLGAGIQYARNLSGGADNNDTAYAGNRLGADREWHALRYNADAQWRVAPIVFNARVRGQHANEPLIAGEQFGLGGAASVRGLRERQATGDSGILVTGEVLRALPWEGWFALVFVDAGQVRSKNVVPGQPSHDSALSIGLGVRWSLARRLSLSIDAARLLDATTTSETGDIRVHASFVYWL